jgi:hypothetical protein
MRLPLLNALSNPFVLFFVSVLLLTNAALSQSAQPKSVIVCKNQDNVEDAACQAELKGLFTRKGNKLTLHLDGGKSRTFVSNLAACKDGDTENCVAFSVVRYFPQTQSYLVENGLYECGRYLFISRHTGSETIMSEIPVLSPNAKYLLLTDDSDACDRPYDIAIWSLQTDPPKLDYKYQTEAYENWELTAWEDDMHIKLKAFISSSSSQYDQEAELVRNAGKWTFQLGRKIDHPN